MSDINRIESKIKDISLDIEIIKNTDIGLDVTQNYKQIAKKLGQLQRFITNKVLKDGEI